VGTAATSGTRAATSTSTTYFTDGEITDYRSTLRADRTRHARFVRLLRERGVFRGASKFYLSIMHDEADVAETIRAFESAVAALAD
jgi:glutamate-1-semialdehyde 2,1-aminomutase